MDIFLVRHGEAAASWAQSADPGLSALGREQAMTAANELQPLLATDTCLISSPLLRAQETAVPLAEALGLEVRVDDSYREIPSSVALVDRQDWLRSFMRQRWEEQPAELHAWRQAILTELAALPGPAVVFTHFLVINAVAGALLERPETLCFYPDNGSITQLRCERRTLELVALGREMQTVVN